MSQSAPTTRSVTHATFTIARDFAAPPAKVFAAFADVKSKAQWFVGPDEWSASDHKMDFRVGGQESVSGGPPDGGPVHHFSATYCDIVENERIVYVYDMHLDTRRISVSLATIELKPGKTGGTKMVLTEQGAYFDGGDNPAQREDGTKGLLDQLDAHLQRQTTRA